MYWKMFCNIKSEIIDLSINWFYRNTYGMSISVSIKSLPAIFIDHRQIKKLQKVLHVGLGIGARNGRERMGTPLPFVKFENYLS